MTAAERILTHAAELPEGTPITARALLHLGARPAIDKALSRLAAAGRLARIKRGVYVLPVASRFGPILPAPELVVARLAASRGETVAPVGAASANKLGLSTQVPVRMIYLTSGRTQRLEFGKLVVELRHAPPWLLVEPEAPAGDAVRALEWLGPEEAPGALARLPREVREQLVALRPSFPTWLAQQVSTYCHA